MTETGPDKLYTTGFVAKVLGCAPRTAAKLLDSGKIPCFRVGCGKHTDRRCERSAIVAYLEAQNIPIRRLDQLEAFTAQERARIKRRRRGQTKQKQVA